MSLPAGIVDIGLAAAKPEETPENGECAFHAIASGLPKAERYLAAAYLRRLVVRGMTTRAVWEHMQSIGGGFGLVAAHQSAVLDNSVHLGHPAAYAAWMSRTSTLATYLELMVLAEILGAVIVIWLKRATCYHGHQKLVPTAPTRVLHILISPTPTNAGHYEGFTSTTEQSLHACVDVGAVSPTGWDLWCKDAPAVPAALAPLRAEATGTAIVQALLSAGSTFVPALSQLVRMVAAGVQEPLTFGTGSWRSPAAACNPANGCQEGGGEGGTAAAASTGTIDRGAGVQSCTYVALANVMTSGHGLPFGRAGTSSYGRGVSCGSEGGQMHSLLQQALAVALSPGKGTGGPPQDPDGVNAPPGLTSQSRSKYASEAERRAARKRRLKEQRAKETPRACLDRLAEGRKQKQAARDRETTAQRDERLAERRRQKQAALDKETTAQREVRLAERRKQDQAARDRETTAQREVRLAEQRKQDQAARDRETTAQRDGRLADRRKQKQAARDRETTAQREVRLAERRKQDQAARDRETTAQRDGRLAEQRKQDQAARDRETTAQRDERLAEQRKQKQAARDRETMAQRDERLAEQRKQRQAARDAESPEERAARRERARLASAHESESSDEEAIGAGSVLVAMVLEAAHWGARSQPAAADAEQPPGCLDFSHGEWPLRQQDLPPDAVLPAVPFQVQVDTARRLDLVLKEHMPTRVCACCSEMKSAVESQQLEFSQIPNVELLRADVLRTDAVTRPAHVVTWRPLPGPDPDMPPAAPDPALPVGFRLQWLHNRGHLWLQLPDSGAAGAVDETLEEDADEEPGGAAADMVARASAADGMAVQHTGAYGCEDEQQQRPVRNRRAVHEIYSEPANGPVDANLPTYPPRADKQPRPDPERPGYWLVPFCMRWETSGPNQTVDAAADEPRVTMCDTCVSALSGMKIPAACLARVDGGDIPEVNSLGQRLETPTQLEAQVLGLGAVHQYVYTLQLKNRPPEAQPVAVTVHGIAVANPPRQQLYDMLPRHPDQLGETISLVCLDVVRDRRELEERLASARVLHVRTRVLVAWANYLADISTAGAVDLEALAAWQAQHPDDAVPASLVESVVAPANDCTEALVRGAFMHDRAGNSSVREANMGTDVAGATGSPAGVAEDLSVRAAFYPIGSAAGMRRMVETSAASVEQACLEELEVVLPVGPPPTGPHEVRQPDTATAIEEQLTREKRLVYCAGGRGAKVLPHAADDVLAACFPTAFPHTAGGRRPMGMSNTAFFRHVSARVPRAQFSGNLPMLARMLDVLHLEESRRNTFVTAKTCGKDVTTVGYIPRDIIKSVATVLALPRRHPERQAALKSSSPLVRALVTTMQRTAGRIDMTDAYYANAQSSLRFVNAAMGPPLLAFNINPADMHSGAAIVAAGEVVEFGDDGAPARVDTVTRRWQRVKENPHACKALLKAVVAAVMEVLFGWKMGARQQENPGCFCGVVFHVTIKVEQSGRLALHIHGLAHLAAFTVERMRELFEGPNCRALALAQALCAMWYPEPYYDPKGADVLVYGSYRPVGPSGGVVPWRVATISGSSGSPALDAAVAPVVEAGNTAADAMCDDLPGPPEVPPPAVDRLPPAAHDFGIIAGSRLAQGAAMAGGELGVKRLIRKRCARHLATVTATTNTHCHSDTCKRHGCAGVDGDCGMEYPRLVRRRFQWIGSGGLFALPRYGRNIVSHMPAVSMAFGANNNFTLACEVDRQLTEEVATELDRPPVEQDPAVVAPVTMPAQLRAHLSSYYACKYVCKPVPSSQAANLIKALAATREFLAAPGAALGGYAPTVENPAARGFGNVMAAVNRLTISVTVGMAMASYRLGGDETIVTTYQTTILTHGAFAALAAAGAPGAGDSRWEGKEGGVDTIIVIPDEEDDGPDAPAAAVTCVSHYRLRGPELDGPECSPFTLAMTYEFKRLKAGFHPAMPPAAKRPRPGSTRDVPPAVAAAVGPAAGLPEPEDSSTAGNAAQQQTFRGTTTASRVVALAADHPWVTTHAHHRFKQARFVRLLGPIPRRPPADDCDSPAAQEYYAFVLGVFKAYRTSPVPPGMTLRAAYEDWLQRILPSAGAEYAAFITSYLDGLERDHECRAYLTEEYNRRRREGRAAGRDHTSSDHDTDEDAPLRQGRVQDVGGRDEEGAADGAGAAPDDSDEEPARGMAAAGAGGELSAFDLHLRNLDLMFDTGNEGRYALGAARACAAPDLQPNAAAPLGYVRAANLELASALRRACQELKNYRACNFAEAVAEVAGPVTGAAAGPSGSKPAQARTMRLARERGATFAVISCEGPAGATIDTRLAPGSRPPMIKLPERPSVVDTINLFTLAADQAVPFMVLADCFNRRNSAQPGEPPQMKVMGGPGTGKSQFMHALLWYTFQHDDPEWLATASYAWTATLAFTTPYHRSLSTHGMFGVGLGNVLAPRRQHEVRSNIAHGGIAIDEIGYNSQEHLGACNRSAQRALDPPDHLDPTSRSLAAFVGRPVALVGDLFQNTQPKGTPIYKWAARVEADPSFSPRKLAAELAAAEEARKQAAASTASASSPPTQHVKAPVTSKAPSTGKDKGKHQGKGKDKDGDDQGQGSAGKVSGLSENAMTGFEVYRTATDVFMLEKQQRQDSSQGGRDLTAYSKFFNGQRPADTSLIRAFVETLNKRVCNLDKLVADATPTPAAAAADPQAWARKFPRVVLQRNAPRHVINTRLMQRAAQLAGKRLVVWNAAHVRAREKGQQEQPAPLSALEELACLREDENRFGKLTPDTWYFEGAPFICTQAQGVEAGSCVNNLVRAVGLITDPREPPDTGRGTHWRLKYLPAAVLVVPVNTDTPHDILGDAFADLGMAGAFPVTPVTCKDAAKVEPVRGSGTIRVRRRNLPLGDAFAVTDFFVQGASFGDRRWVVDLLPTPMPNGGGICTSRACLFVVLTRYRSMDDVQLLRPLFTNSLERDLVVKSFLQATQLPDDLAAEDRLLRRQARATRLKYKHLFEQAAALETARASGVPAEGVFGLPAPEKNAGDMAAASREATVASPPLLPTSGMPTGTAPALPAGPKPPLLPGFPMPLGQPHGGVPGVGPHPLDTSPVASVPGRLPAGSASGAGHVEHSEDVDTACYVCGRRDGAAFILMCDGVTSAGEECARGAHTFCLHTLPCTPAGKWYCNRCQGSASTAVDVDAPVVEASSGRDDPEMEAILRTVNTGDASRQLVRFRPNPALDLQLTAGVMRTLSKPGADVHCDVMEVLFRMLQVFNNDLHGRGIQGVPRCYFMGTYFLDRLVPGVPHGSSVVFENVSRWTSLRSLRRSLLAGAEDGLWSVDRIVVPVHWPDVSAQEADKAAVEEAAEASASAAVPATEPRAATRTSARLKKPMAAGHWMCGVVDLSSKRVEVYDSLGPSQDNAKVGGLLLQWVKLASVAAQRPIAESEWSIVRPADVPRQRMRDCGAYTLLFAYCMARGLNVPARDTPIDMKAARQAFTYMLMTGRVGLRPLPVG